MEQQPDGDTGTGNSTSGAWRSFSSTMSSLSPKGGDGGFNDGRKIKSDENVKSRKKKHKENDNGSVDDLLAMLQRNNINNNYNDKRNGGGESLTPRARGSRHSMTSTTATATATFDDGDNEHDISSTFDNNTNTDALSLMGVSVDDGETVAVSFTKEYWENIQSINVNILNLANIHDVCHIYV